MNSSVTTLGFSKDLSSASVKYWTKYLIYFLKMANFHIIIEVYELFQLYKNFFGPSNILLITGRSSFHRPLKPSLPAISLPATWLKYTLN